MISKIAKCNVVEIIWTQKGVFLEKIPETHSNS